MSRDYRLFLDDILDAIEKIDRYISDLTLEDFINDDKTADAVIRNFEVIGEASRNIPDGIKKNHINIPWREMREMRNILIHEYFGVDYSVIYKTVKDFLPTLKVQILDIINEN